MKRSLLSVPIMAVLALASGCELAVQLDPALVDGGPVDACNICADVSADVNYDVGDVGIYGPLPGDGGVDASDATVSTDGAPKHDGAVKSD